MEKLKYNESSTENIMNLSNLISSTTGLLHFAFSIFALALGTAVIFRKKGTRIHKRLGYFYLLAMLGVNISAFLLFRLYGRFGLFHWMAVLSMLTLTAGILPMIVRKPKSYISLHFGFMYWSVIGLYGAFVAEMLVRLPKVVIESGTPNAIFYRMVGIGVGITMALGAFFFLRNQKRWSRFDRSIKAENVLAEKVTEDQT